MAIISSCAGPYTIENSGNTVNLSEDDVFEVVLQGNSSTGYTWQVMPYDETVLSQVGDVQYTPKDDKIGSGGTYNYKFKTMADGETDLVIVYKRRFEEPTRDDKKFEMKIVVGTMGRILEE